MKRHEQALVNAVNKRAMLNYNEIQELKQQISQLRWEVEDLKRGNIPLRVVGFVTKTMGFK